MKNIVNTKMLLTLALIIIATNTQDLFYINYYFPGTYLITLIFLATAQGALNLKRNDQIKWISFPFLVIVATQILMGIFDLDTSFTPVNFVSLLSAVCLGIFTKKITIAKNWRTYSVIFLVWAINIIWSAVTYKQGISSSTRIFNGDSPSAELFIVNRFLYGVVSAIEICTTLSIINFNQPQQFELQQSGEENKPESV